MNNNIKQYLKRFTIIKCIRGWYQSKKILDWVNILQKEKSLWESAIKSSNGGAQILLATSMGAYQPATLLDSLLSVALTLRKAEVHVLLCDSILPACQLCDVYFYHNQKDFIQYGPSKDLCKSCFAPSYKIFTSLGIHIHRYSEFVTQDEINEARRISSKLDLSNISSYRLDGIAVGEHALAGALRFYARGSLEEETLAEVVLRQYLNASLLTTYAMRGLLKKFNFKRACFHHGIYVPQGLIGEVCRNNGVKVVNWHVAYRKKCFIFSHDDSYHHTLMSEPVTNWENIPWTSEMEVELMDYLKSRWHGTKDWIWFHDKPEENLSVISKEIGVDFSKPCIGMLTNVIWDAQLHYSTNAFVNMLDWVLQTISYFAKRPELQLLIRVHPAEIRGTLPSRQCVVNEIKKVFAALPKNVFVIPPESQVSTYAAMSQCNAVIIYGTKTGVELTSMGIPVIVAGEAWIRNKGITIDASSVEDYFKILDKLPIENKMNEATLKRARKYAYHFFFRRMIPLEFLIPAKNESFYFQIELANLKQLFPGQNLGLDVICNGILHGTDFIYPSENIQ